MFFCESFKSTFFTQLLRVTASGSSDRYLKTYENDINWDNSDFNANAKRTFVFCDNFGSLHSK